MSGCIFCEIVAGSERASVVYEDDAALAFMDLRQPNPGHVLVIPKTHVETVYELDQKTAAGLFQAVVLTARAVRRTLQPPGLNISQSNGVVAGQEVFHVHIHLMPRQRGDRLFRMYSRRPAYPERAVLDQLAITIRSGFD